MPPRAEILYIRVGKVSDLGPFGEKYHSDGKVYYVEYALRGGRGTYLETIEGVREFVKRLCKKYSDREIKIRDDWNIFNEMKGGNENGTNTKI